MTPSNNYLLFLVQDSCVDDYLVISGGGPDGGSFMRRSHPYSSHARMIFDDTRCDHTELPEDQVGGMISKNAFASMLPTKPAHDV